MKKLSIILIDWNVRESFHAIDYLINQTVDRDMYEIIWVEYYNNRPDIISNSFEAGDIDKWIVLEKTGMYFKHLLYNEGVAFSEGEIICICDSDAVFSPTFVESIISKFEEFKNENIILYLDQVRNNDESLYPFKGIPWDVIMNSNNLENWDYEAKKPRGLTIEYKPERIRNYGACFCARRDSVIDFGGFDQHPSYHCFICGPYELGWRMLNKGYKEIWHHKEWLLHVWHPWVKPGSETVGYHDGAGINETAHELRRNKRFMPYLENDKIKKLRLDKSLVIEAKPSTNETIMAHYENSAFVNRLNPKLDSVDKLFTFYKTSRVKRLIIACEDYEDGEKLFNTLKSAQLVNYIEIFIYSHYFLRFGQSKMINSLYNTCKHFKPEMMVFIPVKGLNSTNCNVEPTSDLFRQIAADLGIRIFAYDMRNEGRLQEFEEYATLVGANNLILEKNRREKSMFFFPDINGDIYRDMILDRDIDVMFCGSIIEGSCRDESVEYLRENGIKVFTRLHRLPDKVYAEMLNRTKICLSIPRENEKIAGIERRSLEIMYCNALLMEDASLNTACKYDNTKSFVTFNNKYELLDKVRYYLSNEKERLDIANSGHMISMEKFNAIKLWEDALKKCGFEKYCNNELYESKSNKVLTGNKLIKMVDLCNSELSKVAIFGASTTGMKCYEILKDKGVDVPFFIDNSTERQGTCFMTAPVYSPECLRTEMYDVIDGIAIGIGGDSLWAILQLKELLFDKAIITMS